MLVIFKLHNNGFRKQSIFVSINKRGSAPRLRICRLHPEAILLLGVQPLIVIYNMDTTEYDCISDGFEASTNTITQTIICVKEELMVIEIIEEENGIFDEETGPTKCLA